MQDVTSPDALTLNAEVKVERLSREVEELRAVVEALAGEPRPEARRSGRRRRGRAHSDQLAECPGLVSRRRLFGLLGGAAAAGAGLAVAGSTLTADPAGATNGDPILIGSMSNSGTSFTTLTSTGNQAFIGLCSTTNGTGLVGEADTGTGAVGVLGISGQGYGVAAQGNGLAPLRLSPSGSISGPPSTGTHKAGEIFVDNNGALFCCTADGMPGTWVNLSTGSNLVTLSTPARVYDSRVGQLPSTGPKSQITNGATVSIDVTGAKAGGGNSGVPSGATAVLGNITMINGPNTTFLTVFAAGTTAPATSNINALGGQVIANNFTSQIGSGSTNSNKISVQCGFGPTDFIIDIFGYYP
jgi:hypothetical protein